MSLQNHPRVTGKFWSLPSKGGLIIGGYPPYTDGRNLGVHHRFGIVVDGEGGGDGVILLKEGDGFYYDEDGHNE